MMRNASAFIIYSAVSYKSISQNFSALRRHSCPLHTTSTTFYQLLVEVQIFDPQPVN
jgi:hypothetical protein